MAIQSSTVCLYYGDSAEDAALDAAERHGKILMVLGSEKGVRKDDAREMLALHNTPPVSDALGSVVIGPMDLATVDASDALLKIVEEPSTLTQPFLWAHDLGQVSKTIRSRCHTVWANQSVEDYQYTYSTDLLDKAIAGDGIAIAELLMENPAKGALSDIIHRMSQTKVSPEKWRLYKSVLGKETTASVASVLAVGAHQ